MTKKNTGPAIDVAAVEVADDPQLAELQQIVLIDKINEVAKFNPIKARAAALVNEIESTVYDINTTEGEDTAKALRRRCVGMRTSADAVYKAWNRPVLDAQTEMRAIVAGIVKLVDPVETVLDEAIKAKEKIREDARLAKIAAEQTRISALRAKITSIAGFPTAAAKATTANEITVLLATLDGCTLDEATYEEFVVEATELHAEIRTQLAAMLQAAQAREAQAAQLAAQALQLEAERRAQALAAKRASAILEIRSYPLGAMGLDSKGIAQHLANLRAPTEDVFGDSLAEATIAFESALAHIKIIADTVAAAELAAVRQRIAEADAEQRRKEDEAASDLRQHQATASAVLLKNQQDAFEEEKRVALADIAAEKDRLAEERKVRLAQADALANPPPVVVQAADDESTMPATPISDAVLGQAMTGVSAGFVDHEVGQIFTRIHLDEIARTDDNALDIVRDMCWPGETDLSALNRLFDADTHAALVRLHATLKAEQLEEIPA